MTAPAVPAQSAAAGVFLQRHWRVFAVAVLVFVPFLPSLVAMREFLLADNALGFTPVALPAAVYLFWLRAHGDRGPSSRDVLLDVFFMAPLLLVVCFILFITPARLSWYFWLDRVDLAALAPWAAAVGLAFLGYQQMLRTWPAWAMLVLAWPYPLVSLQRELSGAFVALTAAAGSGVVGFLHLPYRVDAEVFTSTHLPAGENFTLIVGQLCSGTAATLGWIVVGVALALMSTGGPSRKLLWLLGGVALAFVSNLVRVGVLLTVASRVSRDTAVDTVHPVLGLALFLLVIAAMLLLLRPFGLRLDPLPHGRRLAWEPAAGGGKPLRWMWALMLAAALGVGLGVAQAQDLNFIGIGDGAPAVAIDSTSGVLPPIGGWNLVHETEISWTDLFGRSSRGDVYSYLAPDLASGGAVVGAQTVVTEHKSTLDRYTLEQCIDFHGRTLEARSAVDLGHGVTGVLLHDTYEGIPSSILYWIMPVTVDGDLYHARVALFGDVEAPTLLPGQAAPGATSSAVTRLGRAFENAMDGLPAAADPARAGVDRGLVQLAVQIVDTMVESGGSAAARAVSGRD